MARRTNVKQSYILASVTSFSIAYFMTYILGTILIKISNVTNYDILLQWGNLMIALLGPAIGIAIGSQKNLSYLGLISAMMAGTIGLGSVSGNLQVATPIIAYLCVVIIVFIIEYIEKNTPFDLWLLPILSVLIAGIIKQFVAPLIVIALTYITGFTSEIMYINPFLMGMIIAFVSGIIFSSPITMIAISSILNFTPLASAAAMVGVFSHLIGFGIMSVNDNDLGDVLAIVFGTSMLQFANIIKKPIVLIPPVITSIICGGLSAGLFKIETSIWIASEGIMPTSIMDTINIMGISRWILVILCCVVIPIVCNMFIYQLFKRARYINNGDLKIIK